MARLDRPDCNLDLSFINHVCTLTVTEERQLLKNICSSVVELYGVEQCGTVWCGLVWCCVVQCGTVWNSVVQFGVVWCSVEQCSVEQCSVEQCSVEQCGGTGAANHKRTRPNPPLPRHPYL